MEKRVKERANETDLVKCVIAGGSTRPEDGESWRWVKSLMYHILIELLSHSRNNRPYSYLPAILLSYICRCWLLLWFHPLPACSVGLLSRFLCDTIHTSGKLDRLVCRTIKRWKQGSPDNIFFVVFFFTASPFINTLFLLTSFRLQQMPGAWRWSIPELPLNISEADLYLAPGTRFY